MRFRRLTTRLRLGEKRNGRRQHHDDEVTDASTNVVADECFDSTVEIIGDGALIDDHSSASSFIISSPDNNIDLDTDDSDSDGDESDMDLPPGYLEFLSSQQSDVDDELSEIADQLRGNERRSSPLFQIHLVRRFVYDKGAITIARAMESGFSPSHLREIVLSRCHIGDDGTCALAHAISISCASLKTLDLSSNNITGVGATCLANCTVMGPNNNDPSEYLESCGGSSTFSIETLVLSSNPILSVGALALSSALRGHRSKCGCQQKGRSDEVSTNSSTSISVATGNCSLKNLHVSGCQLNDDDAIALGNALRPPQDDLDEGTEMMGMPSLSPTNNLKLLNLHGNCINLKGMKFLYSVINNFSPPPPKHEAGDHDSYLSSLQSLYCQSNHTTELGLVVDYGTRDYNYGNFFDQEEDEQLLMNMRNYEMSGIEPPNLDIEQLKTLMMHKWLLKEKMMHALHINRECALALEEADMSSAVSSDQEASADTQCTTTTREKRGQILCTAAKKKIKQVLEEKVHPQSIVLPRRQDEYGKYLYEDDSLGLGHLRLCVIPPSPSIGKRFTNLDLNVFPQVFSWMNRHSNPDTALAIVFDILCENPDVCGFHSDGA